MPFRNPRFRCALALTLSQQLLLALSTYHIVRAGSALAQEDIERVLHLVCLFFICALAAYITSSIGTLLTTRAANQLRNSYSRHPLSISTTSTQYASEKNRKSMTQWLAAEAQSTIA